MSGEKENYSEIEYHCNICLNSSLIDKANKINALTLLSFINYNNKFYNILFYLNNRIFKYLGKDKGIEAFIFIRTLYRASNILMDNYKNYFYSYYYVKLAEIIKDKSKIDKESIVLLLKLIKKVKTGTEEYIKIKQKLFVETFNKEKVNYIKNILNNIGKDNNNNKDENLYYVINKEWLDKAYNFINEYERSFNLNNEEFNNFIEKSFNFENVYSKYIGEEKTNIIINEEDQDFPFFPGPIDNYSITVFKDFWNDNDNIQDNYFIKDNLILNKDYYLINKEIWNELNNIFQSTNEIRRIGNDNDLIVLKCIIFENNLRNKDYVNHLRRKYIQISKKNSVYDLKIKILRAINKMRKTTLLLKKNIKFDIDYQENKLTEDNTNEIDENSTKKRINFYECSYDKKDILSEMIILYANSIKSIYYEVNKLNINESLLMENFPNNGLRKNNNLLLIEIKDENENDFLNEINNKCIECEKEINKEKEHKCEKCHINQYCSLKCLHNSKIHLNIHKNLDEFIIEEFNLKKLFQTNIKEIIKENSNHGISGLYNLGNTCFMNSIIQCLSNTEDLTKYFLLDYYEQEMNLGNRLGSNGEIVESYSKLIKLLWNENNNNEAIKPDFLVKQIIKKLNQYSTLNQQDAHEFLSLFLDNLHEDINRIINKPYIELKEKKENENDEEASYRWWKSHRLRDNSIISDLFYGQLKCDIKCLNCNKSSITYSPFMSLSLNLPISSNKIKLKFFYKKNCYFIDFLIWTDCKVYDFKNRCFELNVLKDSHFENNINLIEAVVLNKEKIITKIIHDDEELVNNYLKDGKEIILFKKDSLDCFNIYCYPILTYTEESMFFGKNLKINFLSYPIAISVNNNTTIEELKQLFFNELSHMFINNDAIKNINLLIYHNYKEKGFHINFFSTKPTCEFCNQKFNQSPFCSIESNQKKEKIYNIINKLQNNRPLIFLIKTDNYKSESAYINLDMKIQNYISKDLTETQISTIYNSLESFNEEEKLNDNEWYCNICKEHKPALKKLNIYRAPNYLMITLKRFRIRNGIRGRQYGRKNEVFIYYPINDLNLSNYVYGNNNSKAVYNLYGVVEHFGGLTQGHYIAKCKNLGKWYTFNDKDVEEIQEKNLEKSIVNKNAYILFYKRTGLENEF
jgi:ubiquitin carboxyl-terminal hydrolase 4/11/15